MLIIHNNFYSPQLDRTRSIRVLLPRNYEKEVHKRFPVIYLQDGQNLFEAETAAFGYWKLQTLMARQPLIRQAILVGIDNAGFLKDAPRRRVTFTSNLLNIPLSHLSIKLIVLGGNETPLELLAPLWVD
jgi:predicted alpha/beta superfamily hydrolase